MSPNMAEKWAKDPRDLRTLAEYVVRFTGDPRDSDSLLALAAQLEALGDGPPEKPPTSDHERLWQAALAAMQGLIANEKVVCDSEGQFAAWAYRFADAQLAEFKRRTEKVDAV